MRLKRRALWLGWLAIAFLVLASTSAQLRGDTVSGPCTGTDAVQATQVHFQPALISDASWADFYVPASATHVVLCQDGVAMSYRILDRKADSVRMRIGNRWVIQHMLQQDLDIYAQPERWSLLFDDAS